MDQPQILQPILMFMLIAKEWRILDEHQGCYQCCHWYVDHCARNCPDKRKALTLLKYNKCKLTPVFAKGAKVKFLWKENLKKKRVSSITVMAVFEGSKLDEDSSDSGSKYVIPWHITYSCLVSGISIALVFIQNVLIDTGSSLALISSILWRLWEYQYINWIDCCQCQGCLLY